MSCRIDVLTIFPELVEPFLAGSLLGQAIRSGRLDVRVTDIRDYATDRHRSVDDAPYGGGDGMVLRCEPVVAAVEAVRLAGGGGARVLVTSPRGRRLDQSLVRELAACEQLVIVCGRYAGFDERILEETGAEELSIGDYVLSGGELPALVLVEAVSRLRPGVLGNPASAELDTFERGLLEHPSYTRPRRFRGREVPEVLLSGDHQAVESWRREQAIHLTAARRPDLLGDADPDGGDRPILGESEK